MSTRRDARPADTIGQVTASATKGTATEAEIKAQQSKVLKGLGKGQGPVSYKLAGIHGVAYALSEVVTKTAQGKLLDVVLLDTVHGAYLYDFEAFLLYNVPSTKPETKTVQQILNSIRHSIAGIGVTELLAIHPDVPRRTAQRWLRQLIEAGNVTAVGRGPAPVSGPRSSWPRATRTTSRQGGCSPWSAT